MAVVDETGGSINHQAHGGDGKNGEGISISNDKRKQRNLAMYQ